VLCLRVPVGEAEDAPVDVPAEAGEKAPAEELEAGGGAEEPEVVTVMNPLGAADGVEYLDTVTPMNGLAA
jgi:hypothetical protein